MQWVVCGDIAVQKVSPTRWTTALKSKIFIFVAAVGIAVASGLFFDSRTFENFSQFFADRQLVLVSIEKTDVRCGKYASEYNFVTRDKSGVRRNGILCASSVFGLSVIYERYS